MVDFGNTLKTLRLRENMTQAQLAQKLGLTKSVISAYETGLRLPSYDVLIHISKIFKVSTDYLLGVESQQGIDLSGISEEEVTALKNLIKPCATGIKNSAILIFIIRNKPPRSYNSREVYFVYPLNTHIILCLTAV